MKRLIQTQTGFDYIEEPEPVDHPMKALARTMDNWANQPSMCLLCNKPMKDHPPQRALVAKPRYCQQALNKADSDE